MDSFAESETLRHLPEPRFHPGLVRPDECQIRAAFPPGAASGRARKSLQQQIRAFFLRQPSQKQDQFGIRRNSEFFSEIAALRQNRGRIHAVTPQKNFLLRDSTGHKFAAFLFGGGNHETGSFDHLPAKEAVIDPLQPQVAHDWQIHSDWFDHVRNPLLAAFRRRPGAQQIVKPENVCDIKILQLRPQIFPQPGVPAGCPVMKPFGQIDDRYSASFPRAAVRPLARQRFFRRFLEALLEPPIRRQNAYLVPSAREALGERAHFHGRAAKLKKRGVALRDVQDSHSSRRIFFKPLAKVLKRYSFSTRSRPRAPICFASSGFASSVSIEEASCATSPCWTR